MCSNKRSIIYFSLDEASAYFHTDEQKYMIGSAAATPYTINQNIQNSEDNDEKVAWWLRTSGYMNLRRHLLIVTETSIEWGSSK